MVVIFAVVILKLRKWYCTNVQESISRTYFDKIYLTRIFSKILTFNSSNPGVWAPYWDSYIEIGVQLAKKYHYAILFWHKNGENWLRGWDGAELKIKGMFEPHYSSIRLLGY